MKETGKENNLRLKGKFTRIFILCIFSIAVVFCISYT